MEYFTGAPPGTDSHFVEYRGTHFPFADASFTQECLDSVAHRAALSKPLPPAVGIPFPNTCIAGQEGDVGSLRYQNGRPFVQGGWTGKRNEGNTIKKLAIIGESPTIHLEIDTFMGGRFRWNPPLHPVKIDVAGERAIHVKERTRDHHLLGNGVHTPIGQNEIVPKGRKGIVGGRKVVDLKSDVFQDAGPLCTKEGDEIRADIFQKFRVIMNLEDGIEYRFCDAIPADLGYPLIDEYRDKSCQFRHH